MIGLRMRHGEKQILRVAQDDIVMIGSRMTD